MSEITIRDPEPEAEVEKEIEVKIPERLVLEDQEGWLSLDDYPYKIYYETCLKTCDTVAGRIDDITPARWELTPDSNRKSRSVSIWLHESIPVDFRDIVMFHELLEAELNLWRGLNEEDAHNRAETETQQYAEKNLGEEDLKKYNQWIKKLDARQKKANKQ